MPTIPIPQSEYPGLVGWLMKEFGANVLNTTPGESPLPIEDISSTRKIFEGSARQLLDKFMAREGAGPVENWLEYAITACSEYKLDAVLLTFGKGSKVAWAMSKLLKDEIADRVGIPALALEMDSVDGQAGSGESVRAAIKDFLTTML